MTIALRKFLARPAVTKNLISFVLGRVGGGGLSAKSTCKSKDRFRNTSSLKRARFTGHA